MNYYLINATAAAMTESMDTSIPFVDRMAFGGQTLLLGMGIVMSVLAFLWFVLEMFRIAFYRPAKKTAEPQPEITEAVPESEAAEEDDGELVAAISAAIAAYLDSETQSGASRPSNGFRIVSYRKITRSR